MDINQLIEKEMVRCDSYDENCCDSAMCSDCALLNRNLALEYFKINDLCFNCRGRGTLGRMSIAFTRFTPITMLCNTCNGMGSFLPSIER